MIINIILQKKEAMRHQKKISVKQMKISNNLHIMRVTQNKMKFQTVVQKLRIHGQNRMNKFSIKT